MTKSWPVAAFLCLASALGFGESWSGVLVDSRCYDSEETNVNPYEPYHDQELEVRFCRPNVHTKAFAIVLRDWLRLRLDPGGSAKAADLVRNSGKKTYLGVVIMGVRNKDLITVESISASR